MEEKTNDGDSSNATPRTSNKRVVSIETPLAATTTTTSTSLPSIQESSLPLRNPLHNSDSEGLLFEAHFQANEGVESDSRPVAPIRKASASAFQSDSDRIRALERELNFQEGEEGNQDTASVSSSYVGDVDERKDDIQFQPEGYLSVEPVQPKPGSFNVSSSVHTEVTGAMSASGASHASMATPDCPSSKKEINFSPGGSDIEGPNSPKKGSFVGNFLDSVDAFSETKETAAHDAGLTDTTILDMEAELDNVLANDEAFATGSSEPAVTDAASDDNALTESNIPGESFLKMGSLMQSQLVESGERGTGPEGSSVAKDEHDDFLDEVLDDDLIVAGEKKVAPIEPTQTPKDEHDDLLNSVLDDEGVGDAIEEHQHLIDHDDALLDSMLGDDDVHHEEEMPASSNQADDYVPDESIRKLEALLDEGLAGHDPLAEEVEKEVVSHLADLDKNDDMAHELDALLDETLEEEVQFNDDTPLPTASTKKAKAHVSPTTIHSNATPASSSKKKTPGKVGRFFKSRNSPEKKDEKVVPREASKKKPMFGSRTAQRASDSIRKSFTSRTRRVPKQIAKSPANPPKVSPLEGPKSSPTRFVSMKRFMSPTFASRRRNNEAEEERSCHDHGHFGTPKYSTPKSSWRSSGRSFMSSTLSSLKKMRSTSPDTEDKCRRERRRAGDVVKQDGTKIRLSAAFMEPTFAKTMLETETRILEERKALEREEEAKKIVVKFSWEEDARPSPLIDYSKSPSTHHQPKLQTPSQASGETSKPNSSRKSRFIWTPKSLASGDTSRGVKEKEDVTPLKHTPECVFSPRSLGSLSSMCSIHSFVSPKKAGIRGCQSKYNPTLHKFRAPCELCIFRLSDEEKEELDAHGRHFMVQFTLGGCSDCKAFPTSFDEPPVRLCMKCFAASHRPEKKRMRKKGNDAAIKGYSFAKTDYA